MSRRRAFMIAVALFVMVVITVMGLAYLGSGSLRYKGAAQNVAAKQALELAAAGVEDARLKLERDPWFPPPNGDLQSTFTYTETMTDVGTGVTLGTYTVTVDNTWSQAPYYVIRVTSRATVSSGATQMARAEIDICPVDRTTGLGVNPNLYRVINWTEEGPL